MRMSPSDSDIQTLGPQLVTSFGVLLKYGPVEESISLGTGFEFLSSY